MDKIEMIETIVANGAVDPVTGETSWTDSWHNGFHMMVSKYPLRLPPFRVDPKRIVVPDMRIHRGRRQ